MQVTLPKPTKIQSRGESEAVFEIQELYPGYGVTIGNALRRVLYSSLPGAAITKVKIKGAPHEFSTLNGVLEDVLEIILNLKQVNFKLHGDEPQIVKIKVKKGKEIKAKDIELPSQVEVANKDAHIATLSSKDASFEAEMTVEAGMGFVAAEEQKKEKVDIGTIPLDAIFTPMRKVNFEVENMRVGDRTDYNRLRIEVATNGTISPEEAFVYATNLLTSHFVSIGNIKMKPEEKKIKTANKKILPKRGKPASRTTVSKKTVKKSKK